MHYDERKCAECGKKLAPKPYLQLWNEIKPPHFCSQKCFDKIGGHWVDDLEEIEPHPPGEEPVVVHEGEVWNYGDRALYLEHHAEREKERIAYAMKGVE